MKDDFFKNVRKDLKNYLPEECGEAVLKLVEGRQKNNFILTEIHLKKGGTFGSTLLNLNPYYEAYASGSAVYSELLQEIARDIVSSVEDVFWTFMWTN